MSIIRALSLPDRGAPFQYRLDELNELAFDRFLPMVKHEPRTILYVDNRVGYVLSHRLPWLRGAEQAGYDVHVTTLTEGDGDRVEELSFTHKYRQLPPMEPYLVKKMLHS